MKTYLECVKASRVILASVFESTYARVLVAAISLGFIFVQSAQAGTIRGRVYDPATGKGVRALVSVEVPYGAGPLRLDSGPPQRIVRGMPIYSGGGMTIPRTAADGTFEFQNLAPGEKLVSVQGGSGYAFAHAWVELLDEADIQLVDFPLQKAATVFGTVVDKAGLPVGGAQVSLVYTDPEIQRFVFAGGHAGMELEANPKGLFAFPEMIKPGVTFRLEAQGSESLPVYSQVLRLHPGEQRDGIVLWLTSKSVRLVVTVEDAQGRPLAGIRVMLQNRLPRPKELELSPAYSVPIGGITDEQGRVEFKGLAPGPWMVHTLNPAARGPGARLLSKKIDLPASAAVKELRVTVRPE